MDRWSRLSAEQVAALPTDEEVGFYEEHGWYISKPVLSDAIIETARRGAERFYRGERDGDLAATHGFHDWDPADGGLLRNNEFVSLRNREIAALVREPIVGAIAARLARTDSVRLLDDQLVYKEGGAPEAIDASTAVGWHADHAYWATCSSDKLITAWIPFHDVDETRSPLAVIDGSHRWSGLEHTRFFNNRDLDGMEENFRAAGRPAKRVTLAMRQGQISFHHCWTLHGSLPNRSSDHRLALAVHIQDRDNHYRQAFGPDGKPVQIADERLCRRLPNGDPDFADPAVFPVIW